MLICPAPLLYVVMSVPVTFAEAGLLSAARLVVAESVIFAQVNVAVVSEMLAVGFFVMLIPKLTVFACAGIANPAHAAIASAAAWRLVSFNRICNVSALRWERY